MYVCMYVYKIVTSTLRPRKGVPHRARRIKKDSQSKPHFKHERRESKKKCGDGQLLT